MPRLFLFAVVFFATQASAEGPGSRIRATPLPPQPAGAIDKDLQRCEALRDEERERCLRSLRDAARADRPPHAGPGPERSGPESTGMGSAAGSTSASGVGGGGTTGGAAPR